MISATVEQQGSAGVPGRGARRLKMWLAIVAVFAVQVSIVFWIGNPPAKPAPVPVVPMVHMAEPSEMLALRDPTLFVLPHRENFSGAAWFNMRRRVFTSTNWTEPARPLPLAPEQLGAAFVAFMQTNRPPRFQPRIDSGLDNADAATPPMPAISTPSRLRVEGDLARLRLLTPLQLPSQTNSDLLTNTVIQLVVDPQGKPFSWMLLGRSGSDGADNQALTNFARVVRFAPRNEAALMTVPSEEMTSGQLIFEWQTVPSNAPPVIP